MDGTAREDAAGCRDETEAEASSAAGLVWDEYRNEWRDPWDVQGEEREAAWQRKLEMMPSDEEIID